MMKKRLRIIKYVRIIKSVRLYAIKFKLMSPTLMSTDPSWSVGSATQFAVVEYISRMHQRSSSVINTSHLYIHYMIQNVYQLTSLVNDLNNSCFYKQRICSIIDQPCILMSHRLHVLKYHKKKMFVECILNGINGVHQRFILGTQKTLLSYHFSIYVRSPV